MRRSIATVSLSGSLVEKLEAAARAGFDGVEIFDADLIASPLSPREIRSRCADLGLRIELFQPFRDAEGLSREDALAAQRRFSRKLGVMEQLGARDVLVCSNASPDAIDDIDLSVAQLAALSDLAAERGVRIHFEALAWGTHINRFSQAWEVVRRVARDNVRVTLDTFHLLSRGDDASALEPVPPGMVGFVQIADAPVRDENLLSWSRHHRCFPGQGDWNLAPIVRAALDRGYDGPLSLEVFSDIIREAPAERTATDALRSLVFLEQELAVQDTSPPRPALPYPQPGDVRIAFVEFAAGEQELADIARLFEGLGFRRAGRHRSKDVNLWTNGRARIVLANRPVGSSAAAPRTLGLSVDDIDGLRRRAAALDWPRETLAHEVDEVDFVATRTPSGLEILACERDAWLEDFEEASRDRDAAGCSAAPFLGIDHIGSPVSFTDSDAALSYWRTLFGLRAGAISEVNELRGWMRSRVIGAGSSTQVVLNVAEGEGERRTPGRLDQIALAVPDVMAAVRRARTAGVPMLGIPDNYYDDLEARFRLEPSLLDDLRRHRIMYDQDAHGTLLHAYTTLQPSGFYVELVQRIGDYQGFGAANTAVRIAAQGR